MTVEEIISRPDNILIQQHEAAFLIEKYIEAKKNVKVKIALRTDRDIMLMMMALPSAVYYFKSKQ